MTYSSIPTSTSSPGYRENWMERLTAQVPEFSSRPLTSIAFPGSHDSGTSSISSQSSLLRDSPYRFLANIPVIGSCCVKPVIARWSLTQDLNVAEQMENGIRFFDFRVAQGNASNGLPDRNFFLCHALIANPLAPALEAVAQFVEKHPYEVIFLDFKKFYDWEQNSDNSLIDLIKETVGPYLYPYDASKPVSDVTPTSIREMKKTVILIYHKQSVTDVYKDFWPENSIVSPWIDTTCPHTLVTSLCDNLKAGRPKNSFYVSQCVLTPVASTVLKSVCCCCSPHCHGPRDLREMAQEAREPILEWLSKNDTARQDINIAISDFVDADKFAFIDTIIGLNVSRF